MNAPQFMAYVAFQQEVTDCRAALTDARQLKGGRLSHLPPDQALRVVRGWQAQLEVIQETRACALDRAGLTASGLPR